MRPGTKGRRGGQGALVGGKLVEAIRGVKIRQCGELYLEVRCINTDAVKLYEKLGFIIQQRLEAYYRDGEDS